MANVDAHTYSGTTYTTNITADAVVKATATPFKGKIGRVIVLATTATAAITINDCATVAAAAASNTILNIPTGTTAGTIYTLDFPVFTGIVAKFGTATGTLLVVYE